jgi:hypothetical protein
VQLVVQEARAFKLDPRLVLAVTPALQQMTGEVWNVGDNPALAAFYKLCGNAMILTMGGALADILRMAGPIGEGMSRAELQTALPAGAARNALDCGVISFLVRDHRKNALRSAFTHRPVWQVHRRKLRVKLLCNDAVIVIAGDRDFFRDFGPARAKDAIDLKSHLVGSTTEYGRRIRQTQHPVDILDKEPGFGLAVGQVTGGDYPGIIRNSSRSEGVTIAGCAQLSRLDT